MRASVDWNEDRCGPFFGFALSYATDWTINRPITDWQSQELHFALYQHCYDQARWMPDWFSTGLQFLDKDGSIFCPQLHDIISLLRSLSYLRRVGTAWVIDIDIEYREAVARLRRINPVDAWQFGLDYLEALKTVRTPELVLS